MNTPSPTLHRGDSSLPNFLRMLRPILDEMEWIGTPVLATDLAKLCRNRRHSLPVCNRNSRQIVADLNNYANGHTFQFDDLEITVCSERDPDTNRPVYSILFDRIVSLEQQYLNSLKEEASNAA